MNESKKKYIKAGAAAVAIVALIGGVFVLGKSGIFNRGDKSEPDNMELEQNAEDSAEGVENISYEEGALSVEEVLAPAAGYDTIYQRLVAYYDDMYAEEDYSGLDGDFVADGEDVLHDEEYYNVNDIMSFTEVQEHDTAKDKVCQSDGKYAYMVRNDNSLCIMKVDGSTMEHMSVISDYEHEMESVMKVYVSGDNLVLITCFTEEPEGDAGIYLDKTMIYSYDMADRTSPVLTGSIEMDGYYMGSKMTETGIYVYTSCHKDGFLDMEGNVLAMEELDPSAYIPVVNDTVLAAENIYAGNTLSDTAYLICASVEFASPGQVKDAKAFLSVDSQSYTGENSIYLTLKKGMQDADSTVMVRLDFTDGMIVPAKADAIAEAAMPQLEGFNGYLCAYGEDKILGISYVINEETLAYEGVRLSMFDASDPANIKEENTLTVQADTTPVVSDTTGLFLDMEQGLIGFPTEDWDENYINVENYYRIYRYSVEAGFQSVLEARLGGGSCWYARGFAVGNTFYVAEQDSGNIRSYDMTNGYAQTGEMYY